MAQATVSLLGLYEYDNTILDGLVANLPSPSRMPKDYTDLFGSVSPMDSDALCNLLLMDCAELEFLLANPKAAKLLITSWAGTQRGIWQNLYNTLWYKYNPIWNKDGTRTLTETEQTDKTGKMEGSSTENSAVTEQANSSYSAESAESTTTSGTESGSTTKAVIGFNESTFADRERDTTSKRTESEGNSKGTESGEGAATTTTEGAKTGSQTEELSNTETKIHSFTETDKGNIGVTSSQKMISEQRDLVQYDLYDYIIKAFKARFCLLIY